MEIKWKTYWKGDMRQSQGEESCCSPTKAEACRGDSTDWEACRVTEN